MVAPKFNPFKPGSIVHPAMFVGREDEVTTIERCLFQSKHGNPQHFLVQGERGIGKSSLLLYVEALSSGANVGPFKLDFLTVSIDIGGCNTQLDIVRKMGRGLRSTISERQGLFEGAKNFWEWLTNWEVLGVKYNKPSNQDLLDPEEVAEELVAALSTFCLQMGDTLDGVLFLIDEADRPASEAGLGALLKFLTERLTRKACNRVAFGLAGLPTVMTRLRESHDSSPRLFHTMLLEPLEMEERKRVVRIGLNEANKRNGTPTSITPDALTFLADLSEGYPNFVQQFAYCAFDHDTDDQIDEDDVDRGAFEAGGAIAQLGDKYFNEMYHASISSEDYRRVLDAMADYGDDWVTRKQIIADSGVAETNVTNALQTLKSKNIIITDESRRGFYRLPTNSFAAWINAVRSARAKQDVLLSATTGG